MLLRLLNRLTSVADLVNEFTGRAVSWLTLAMVLVTCAVVVVRYIFNLGSIALQESVMFMHGLVFMLGIAYTLKEQGHVRVDVLHERMPAKVRTLVELSGHVFFLVPVSLFILVGSLDYVSFSWSVRESSAQPGGLPGVYLLKTLIPVMAALLFLQGVSEISRNLLTLLSSKGDSH